MGQTLKKLASRQVEGKAVFNNRFVVEICEHVHVHYRNLRMIMSLSDWLSMASGMSDALKRWVSQGSPEPSEGTHIELCRKVVATHPICQEEININLNKNLYKENQGRIFAEGAEITEPLYVHVKLRDLRIELSLEEFAEFSDAILEAKETLKGGVDVRA